MSSARTQRGLHLIADCLDLDGVFLPIVVDQLENGRKAIRVPLIFGWEIASGKKGVEVRRQKQIVWPSARVGQNLPREHIGLVEIGALFTIHLDADKPLIHQRGDGGIRIDRSLGHMAPVAGAVADGEEDQLVLFSCLPNRFLAPWVPVDWIVGVLQEIGTDGVDQPVRMRFRWCLREYWDSKKNTRDRGPG